jgi:hypothetical protein
VNVEPEYQRLDSDSRRNLSSLSDFGAPSDKRIHVGLNNAPQFSLRALNERPATASNRRELNGASSDGSDRRPNGDCHVYQTTFTS